MGQIALTRAEVIVTVLEDVPAPGANILLAQPPQALGDPSDSAATGYARIVLPTVTGRAVQRGEFLDDEQIRDVRSQLPMIKARLTPGTWSMTTYVKPYLDGGGAPKLPEVHNLALSLMGAQSTASLSGVAGSFKYTLTNDLPSFSSWIRRDDKQVICQRGCTVNQAVFNIAGNAIASIEWSGEFIEQIITGSSAFHATQVALIGDVLVDTTPAGDSFTIVDEEDFDSLVVGDKLTVTGKTGTLTVATLTDLTNTVTYTGGPLVPALAAADVVHVTPVAARADSIKTLSGESRRFMPGGFIFVHDSGTSVYPAAPHASAEVMKITAVNYATDTLTVTRAWLPGKATGTTSGNGTYSPLKTHPAGSLISPWFPSPVGEFEDPLFSERPFRPVHGKFGVLKIDSVAHVVLTSRVTVTNNIRYYIDEKNGVLTAETIGTPGKRQVAVALTKYLRISDTREWTDALNQVQRGLVIPAGDATEPARIMTLKMPQVEFRSPDVGGGLEYEITSEVIPVGTTAGNNELELSFGGLNV